VYAVKPGKDDDSADTEDEGKDESKEPDSEMQQNYVSPKPPRTPESTKRLTRGPVPAPGTWTCELALRRGGDGMWKDANGGEEVVASSESIGATSVYADVEFILYSPNGGQLEYRVRTNATAPNDDFAILFDGEIAYAVSGEMIDYEPRSVEFPRGKVVVTLRQRKNPGTMNLSLLEGLWGVGTDGETWLEDLRFLAD